MSLRTIYNKVDDFARFVFRYKYAKDVNAHHIEHFKKNGIEIKKLSNKQKQEVLKLWKNEKNFDFSSHELYYSITGVFDPKICPEMLFRTKIEPPLNNRALNLAWNDKCYFDRFLQNVNLPYSYIRNVNGVFYDHDYNVISKEKAVELVIENKQSIIKPSMNSGNGRKVALITENDDILAFFDDFKENFVVQVLIKQHETMAKFSKRSVNIVRMNTLFINGKVNFLNASLRASTSDSISDNGDVGEDGEGMIIIGVENDGSLKEKAYYANGKSTSTLPDGTAIKGIKLPNFDKAIEVVEKAHEQLAHFGLLAWDVTFDEQGIPLVIEYNLNGMGLFYYQLVSGPMFEEHTEELVKTLFN